MVHHRIRCCHQPQRLPTVADLSPRLLATPPPQALRLARPSVARWGLAAVMAILSPAAILGSLQTRCQRRHLLPQHGVFGFELSDPFFWRHVPMLHYSATGAE